MAMLRYGGQPLVRRFANLGSIFRSDPIYPESQTADLRRASVIEELDRIRRKRMWQLIKKDAKDEQTLKILKSMEKKVKTPTAQFPNNMMKIEQTPEYFMKLGLVGNDDEISNYMNVDDQTKLPYGLGYDNFVKELKESSSTEARQDLIRDMLRKLGVQSVNQLLSTVKDLDLNKEYTKVKQSLYKIDAESTDKPYSKIASEKNPRSKQVKTGQPKIHPQDFSDNEFENEITSNMNVASEMMNFVEYVNPSRNQPDGYEEEDGDEDLLSDYRYYDKKSRDKLLKVKRKHRDLLKSRIQDYYFGKIREVSSLRFKKLLDLEKETEEKLFEDKKFEKGDTVPGFKQIISSVEEHLSLAGGNVRRRALQDDSEKNWHFNPRYLNQEHNSEDFAWNTFIKEVPSVRAKVLTNRLDPTMEPEELKKYTDLVNKVNSEAFIPKENQKLPANIYRIIRNDSYHRHFLENHLRIFADDMNSGILITKGYLSGIANDKIIPWEYIVKLKQQVRPRKEEQNSNLDKIGRAYGSGRRKTSGAQCWIWPGIGRITVNGRNLIEYFKDLNFRERIITPFRMTGTTCEFDVKINVRGGGVAGQSDAAKVAVAEALRNYEPTHTSILRKCDLLLKDARQVERKKTSKYKARKSYTYVKR